MRIVVRDVPKEGLSYTSRETAKTLDLPPEDMEGDIVVSVSVQRDGETLFLQGGVQALLRLQCSRCLKAFHLPVEFHFTCRGEPLRQGSNQEEVELHRDDMDVHYYEGEALEMNDVFHEQLILSMPMRPLCQENCLGLCPLCGVDLNRGRCSCDAGQKDPRWDALKKLMKKD